MNFIERFPKTILILLVVVFIFSFYGKVVLAPNSYLFSNSGDGIKNYYTYVSQLNQSTWTSSKAMNYPYGESFLYLDCQPVFTIVLKGVFSILPFLKPYSIGIINLLMLASIAFSALLIYRILKIYGLKPRHAILGAFSIAIMSPQIGRITGHLALGYSFFIPLTWYLYLRYQRSAKHWKWTVILFINALFWFFTHAYLGMILTAFVVTFFVAEFVLINAQRSIKHVVRFAVFALLPFGIFWMYALWSDSHYGRTTNPFGFFESTSNLRSVFLPNYGPLTEAMELRFGLKPTWEGMAYVGMSFIFSFILLLVLKFSQRNRQVAVTSESLNLKKHLWAVLIAGFLVLLLAFGYPFNWKPEFLERFEIIKNFRGIGRFAWVFYYSFTIAVFVLTVKQLENRKWGVPVLLGCISVFSLIESIPLHRFMSKHIDETANIFRLDQVNPNWVSVLQQVKSSDYQAIIPLPYFHIGSENFGKEGTEKSYRLSFVCAYHTQLPLMSTYSTRTSLWEAKSSMQLLAPSFYPKTIEKYLPNKKPFLVLFTKENLSRHEDEILQKGVLIAENQEFALYKLSYDALFGDSAKKIREEFDKNRNKCRLEKGIYSYPASASYCVSESFDSIPGELHHSGTGALSTMKNGYTILKEFKAGELKPNTKYIASFWIYNGGSNFGQDIPNGICFYQGEKAAGKIEWLSVVNMSNAFVIDGNWTLIELPFTTLNNQLPSSIVVNGTDAKSRKWIIDDLLIREESTTVYEENSLFLKWNNHFIRK